MLQYNSVLPFVANIPSFAKYTLDEEGLSPMFVCFTFHRLSICKMIKAKVHCIMRVFEYGSLFTFISEISVCCFSCSQHNSWTDLKG